MGNKLTKQEKELLESYENDEWVSVENLEKERKRIQEYARATMRKDKRVNIRISGRDLDEIRKKAVIEGIPYQTLISSILHKYVNGALKGANE